MGSGPHRILGAVSEETAETRWLTPDERAAWLSVAALVVRLPQALDAQLGASSGLTFFEYMVLAVLSEQDDRSMQMSEVAKFASSSLSRLSHTAKRLENAGLLERSPMPGGGRGRRTIARITDAGMDAVRAAAPGHVAEVRRLIIDQLTAEELAVFASAGQRIMDQIDGPGALLEPKRD